MGCGGDAGRAKIGTAHGEFFSMIRPATSMVEVRRLIVPEILVEIEADAIVLDDSPVSEAESPH